MLLDVKSIHTYYGDSHILQGVSFAVNEKTAVAVLGRNGVGKTTLIRSIIGFKNPRRGSIILKGEEITFLAPYEIVSHGIGIVPQGRRLFSSLTVKQNLKVAEIGRPGDWGIDRVLILFPRLGERLSQRAGQLSGGEQQMVAIGRALMSNPDLLLLDEPSEGLAPLIVKELSRVFRQLKDSGFSLLLVEQNLNSVKRVADTVLIMSKGSIVSVLSAKEIYDEKNLRDVYLGV